jgi:urease accessory protein
VPASFVTVMAAGAALAMVTPLPAVELGIVGSLLVLGALVAFSARLPVAVGALIVGVFALFHGHAHGAEMPDTGSAVLFGLGFVVATALLHGIGVAAGLYWRSTASVWLVRAGGAAVAATGLFLLIA